MHCTADGVPVVHHDDELGGRLIASTPYTELRDYRLANDETLPTLADVLTLLDSAVEVFVELKSLAAQHDGALLRVLESGPAPQHYHIHSFDHRIVRRLKTQRPGLSNGVLSVAYPIDPTAPLAAAGAAALWQHERLIDRDLVHALHRKSLTVYAWTVDDPGRMRQLAEMGVNGICTNRPDVAHDALS
jgi:glycerophosphoryl diester phosphodiesterase